MGLSALTPGRFEEPSFPIPLLEAQRHATEVALDLFRGEALLKGRIARRDRSAMEDVSLLQNWVDRGSMSPEALRPVIYEVLLFGSTAREEQEVGDVDLVVLDNGHFSTWFPRPLSGDRYSGLRGNLAKMKWHFDGGYEHFERSSLYPVDLHVLPIMLLTNRGVREKLGMEHHDSLFFAKAFSAIKRFNLARWDWETIDLKYLEGKYNCDLSDLR